MFPSAIFGDLSRVAIVIFENEELEDMSGGLTLPALARGVKIGYNPLTSIS